MLRRSRARGRANPIPLRTTPRTRGEPRTGGSRSSSSPSDRLAEERSGPADSEGVAAGGVAGFETAAKPAGAVARGTVGEGLGLDRSLLQPLEPIVADRGGGSQAFLEVPRLDHVALLVGVEPPHSRVAVGLQLDPDRSRVVAPGAADPVEEPELILDVVADLVGDDVRVREVAGGPETARQLLEETQVQVNLVVLLAVEGPDGSLGEAAGR